MCYANITVGSFVSLLSMGKPLAQITFEFSGENDTPEVNPSPIAETKTEVEMKDTIVEIIEKRIPPATPGKRGRRSLKEIAVNADLVQVPEDDILFQKQYYSIGEVSKWFRVNQSLIRYWETEFDILEPRKNRKGDRFFRPIDVKNLVLIHDLLRRRKFTIEGAKDFLKKNRKADEKFKMIQSLEKIKGFFNELKASLG